MPSPRKHTRNVYCTSFCNQGHDLVDGKPVGHECYVLSPDLLEDERAGRSPSCSVILQPPRTHRGKRP